MCECSMATYVRNEHWISRNNVCDWVLTGVAGWLVEEYILQVYNIRLSYNNIIYLMDAYFVIFYVCTRERGLLL